VTRRSDSSAASTGSVFAAFSGKPGKTNATPPVGQYVPCCVCAICNMEMRSVTVGRRSGGLGIDFDFVMVSCLRLLYCCGGARCLLSSLQSWSKLTLCEAHYVAPHGRSPSFLDGVTPSWACAVRISKRKYISLSKYYVSSHNSGKKKGSKTLSL
jgi:hypothetical protein